MSEEAETAVTKINIIINYRSEYWSVANITRSYQGNFENIPTKMETGRNY